MDTSKSNIVLISDFEDYYDDFFRKEESTDENAFIFTRNKKDEIPRKDIYNLLTKHRLIASPHGKVTKFLKNVQMQQAVLLFTDENRHDGGEKLAISYKEALKKYPNNFMAIYSNSEQGVSYRYLMVGNEKFFMKYESQEKGQWNSLVNPKITVEKVEPEDELSFKPFLAPIVAIDFVHFVDRFEKDWMVAIDVNFAPTLKGTGIEELLPPFMVKQAIEEWAEENKKKLEKQKKKGFFSRK